MSCPGIFFAERSKKKPSTAKRTTTIKNYNNDSNGQQFSWFFCIWYTIFRTMCMYERISNILLLLLLSLHTLSLSLSLSCLMSWTKKARPPMVLSLHFFTLANTWQTKQNGSEWCAFRRRCRCGYCSTYVRFVGMNLCYFNIRFCDTEECISGKMNTIINCLQQF